MARYSASFYERREARVARSADALVPLIVKLIEPRSVVDIGCANGIWLSAFERNGVAEMMGVDGPWVPEDRLRIDPKRFCKVDLGNAPLPYDVGADRRFDMLLSLELLEHLPSERADHMLDLMCRLSDVLVLSAAAPHQGGTGHVNEQWPEYWSSRLAERGYVACDFLRYSCWNDERIAPWYRQNVIGYFKGGVPEHIRQFALNSLQRLVDEPMPLCHPGVFSYKLGKMRSWVSNPVATAIREVKRRRTTPLN